jgi:hypothetical protein
MLLAGAWDDSCAGDRAIIEKLAGSPYEAVLSTAGALLGDEDPPITRTLTSWRLVSREDSWFLLRPAVTAVDLDRFENVALQVLQAPDPRFELPPDERWRARLHDKVPKYSEALRSGMADSLALLATHSANQISSDAIGPQARSERVVRRLMTGDLHWMQWASLAHQLPSLAEAAPDAFLEAVEKDLRRQRPGTLALFDQEGDGLFASSPHVGLLWALETVAWNAQTLSRAAVALARLAAQDPKGRLVNRPINSLRDIFLPWLPQTAATPQQRIAVLRTILKRVPEIGWQLLLRLLPATPDSSSHTHRPQWRDWALTWKREVTNVEYWRQVETFASEIVSNVGNDPSRWRDLIDRLGELPDAARNKTVSMLRDMDPMTLKPNSRVVIGDTLREVCSRHSKYADATWSLPSNILEELDSIRAKFEPDDPVDRNKWLFSERPTLPQESTSMSWQEREHLLERQRQEAVSEVIVHFGFEGLIKLAVSVEAPRYVGFALSQSDRNGHDVDVLPQYLDSETAELRQFAYGYCLGRFNRNGWEWIATLPVSDWTPQQAALFCSKALPFERRTWDLVDGLGPETVSRYWQVVRGFIREPTESDLQFSVSMLLQEDRPLQAIAILAMTDSKKHSLSPNLVLEVLEAALRIGADNQRDRPSQHLRYEIQQLIGYLQSQPNIEVGRLAELEWGYLEILDYGASPKTLVRCLDEEPKFFADLLEVVYRSEEDPEETRAELTAQEEARIRTAQRLLSSWKKVPGSKPGEALDGDALFRWVTSARELCRSSGRLSVCDIKIGEVLAYAPGETDGTWPCVAVRDVIEEIESDELLRGFEIGIFNKRGVHSRSPFEGGDPERKLAKTYADHAETIAPEWPRTAAALQRLAKQYEADARREDERAESRF